MFAYKASEDFAKDASVSGRIEMFKGGSGAYPEFFVTRVVDDKTYAVMNSGTNQEVARITHDFNLGRRDIWTCKVPVGVDEVLMVATTILIDEILESEA